ncbi:MAG TPA: hypothetical protein VGR37_23935 [Longimicrobiaceae bacterium]|nr:hypothetical protein [Longimicrobiaceae bacterium]
MRPLTTVALLLLAATAAPRPAGAQEDAPAGELAAALAPVRQGTMLRVHSRGGGRLEGLLVGVEADVLVIDAAGAEQRIPAAGVEAVWARGRQTRRGATIGGVVAGGAALLYGAFFGLLIAGEGGTTGESVKVMLGSGALGAAGGALAGGVVGSTLTRWYRVYPAGEASLAPNAPPRVTTPEADPVERGSVEPRRLGGAEVAAGYARSPEDGGTDGGLAGRVALVAEFPRGERAFLGVGLEAGRQSLGGTGVRRAREALQVCDPQCEYRTDSVDVRRSYRVSDVGGMLRAGLVLPGVEPYAVLGLGTQFRRTDVLPVDGARQTGSSSRVVVGYSAGAGGRLRRPGAPWTVGVEGRWHSNLIAGQSDGIDEAFGFWTVGATLNRRW